MSGLNAALIAGLFFAFFLAIVEIGLSRLVSRKVFFVGSFFLFQIFYSFYLNQNLAVAKYIVIYLALGLLWVISQKNNNKLPQNFASNENFFNIITFLAVVQILHYSLFVFSSEAYIGINNIDPQARKSVGIYPVLLTINVLFFRNEFSSKTWRRAVIPLAFIVPVLIFLNGSRSELVFLIFSLFMGFCSRGGFGFVYKNLKYLCMMAMVAIYLALKVNENLVLDRIFDLSWSNFAIFDLIDMATETQIIAFQNFRLHESALLIQKILNFDLLEILVGCGIGCYIEYPYPLVLGDLTFYSSAVFHNGFFTLMLQFGLVGLFASVFIIINWLKNFWLFISKRSRISATTLMNYLAHSFLIITMSTSGGYVSLISVCILFPLLYLRNENK